MCTPALVGKEGSTARLHVQPNTCSIRVGMLVKQREHIKGQASQTQATRGRA